MFNESRQESDRPLPVCAADDDIARALDPHAELTEKLVCASARQRLDDFRALACVVGAYPALGAHHEAWLQASQYLEQQTDAVRDAIGASPLFRRWLHATGRTLIESGPASVLNELLASVGNYTIGFQAPAILHARHGMIETWDCKESVAVPRGNAAQDWRCKRHGNEIELYSEAGRFSQPLLPGMELLPQSGIVIRNDLPGLRVTLDETRVPERGEAVRGIEADARYEAYPSGDFSQIAAAAEMVRRALPDLYADWLHTLRVVVPRLPPTGWRMEGFSLSSMQGAIWVHPCDELTVLESLVHENSHVKLRYVEDSVPLLHTAQTEQRFRVGWRSDARPLVGIFEGVYVHIHCARALARVIEAGVLATDLRDRATLRSRALLEQARDGLKLLRKHARVTAAGQGFFDWAQAALFEF